MLEPVTIGNGFRERGHHPEPSYALYARTRGGGAQPSRKMRGRSHLQCTTTTTTRLPPHCSLALCPAPPLVILRGPPCFQLRPCHLPPASCPPYATWPVPLPRLPLARKSGRQRWGPLRPERSGVMEGAGKTPPPSKKLQGSVSPSCSTDAREPGQPSTTPGPARLSSRLLSDGVLSSQAPGV